MFAMGLICAFALAFALGGFLTPLYIGSMFRLGVFFEVYTVELKYLLLEC
jgi:hypothetical protein